jgi:acyl-coenzyme A thioesterase PaaI-like protein
MSSNTSLVRHIMDFLSIAARRGKLGFETPLRLTYFTMNPRLMNPTGKVFTYRYNITPGVCLHGNSISLSTYLALIDSLTTFAVVGAGARPGVSVQLQAELNHAVTPPTKEVDIVSTVTKLGRTLAFIRAEVRTVDRNELVCFASHVKYLPTGSWIMDFLFTQWGWPLMKMYVNSLPELPAPEEISVQDAIQPYLEHTGLGHAKFTVQQTHTNPFGTLHGGCQSILMEIVSQALAKVELKSDEVNLESIQVAYATSGKGSVTISTELLSRGPGSVTLRVLVIRSDGLPISEGTLRWSTMMGQSKL